MNLVRLSQIWSAVRRSYKIRTRDFVDLRKVKTTPIIFWGLGKGRKGRFGVLQKSLESRENEVNCHPSLPPKALYDRRQKKPRFFVKRDRQLASDSIIERPVVTIGNTCC